MYSSFNIPFFQTVKFFILVGLLFASHTALAATLSVSPSTGVYTAGQTFSASVVVNTSGSPVNAAEGTLRFNSSELAVVSVSRGSSIFNLWTQEPSFSNSAGTISFGGGLPSGYTGSRGTVFTITFRSLNAGTTKVNFGNAAVLAADGLGTNVLTSMNGGSYTIGAAGVQPEPETVQYVAPANTPAAPKISSATHPNPANWYKTKNASLAWSIPSGVTSVRTLLDGNSGSIPTKVYENPISSINLNDLNEGVSYFHIQFRNEEGWGRVAHYRLAVDSISPTEFVLSVPEDADLSNPNQTLNYTFKDQTSSASRFIVNVDDDEPFEYVDESGSSTIALPQLDPGRHTVIIEAFDAAGNSISSSLTFSILAFDKPVFTDYPLELNEGVIPVIKGLTRQNSEVTVTVGKIGTEPTVTTVLSDNEGVFTFIPDSTFSLGVYELTAVAIDEYGAQSEPSETVRIAVQAPGYIQIGSLVVSILSVFVPLLALLGLLVILLLFGFRKLRRFRGTVSKEAGEALDILSKEFGELRSALTKGEKDLVASRKTKKLTKSEASLIETMKAELADSEKRVKKEITDVKELTKNEKSV